MFRIATNYARMAVNLVLGLFLIRILLEMGEGVYAVVVLIGTSIGISGMMKEIIRAAIIADVGIAFNNADRDEFQETYLASFAISFVAAVGAVFILMVFWLLLPYFSIPPDLLGAAGVFLGLRAILSFVSVLLAPLTNMLVIARRMGIANLFMGLERAVEVIAAIAVLYWSSSSTPSDMLIEFALYSATAMLAVNIIWAVSATMVDSGLVPKFSFPKMDVVKKIIGTVGWNGYVVAAMNLYGPLMILLVNALLGVAATVVFGIAMQLGSYIRVAVTGIVFGLDAVFTSRKTDLLSQPGKILTRITRLQSMIVFGACAFCATNIHPIINLWLGERLSDPQGQVSQISMLFLILITGIIARSVTEGWMKFLSGIGEVRSYAPLLLKGALFSPPLMLILIYLLPEHLKVTGPAIAFSSLLLVVHIVQLPKVVSRFTNNRVSEVLSPMVWPAILGMIGAMTTIGILTTLSLPALYQLAVSASIFTIIIGPPFVFTFSKLPANS